ncbi:S-adenosyl-L-methionine-dependent methyltransferase, partial [Mycena galericulata]
LDVASMPNIPFVLVPARKRKAPPLRSSNSGPTSSPPPKKKQRRGQEGDSDPSVTSDITKLSDELEYLEEEELELEEDVEELENVEQIPVRKLSGFSILDSQDRMIETTELLGNGIYRHSFTASGMVKVQHVEPSGDEDDGYLVKGLKIEGFNVHHVSAEGDLDENVYIKTHRAWYILDTPAPVYEPWFIPFWIRHRFTHLIVSSSLCEPKVTYDEFVDSLPDPLTEAQLKSVEVIEYFRPSLAVIDLDLRETCRRNIKTSPLVRTLTSRTFTNNLHIPKRLTDDDGIYVTPVVGRLATPYMKGTMRVLDSDFVADPVPLENGKGKLLDHEDPTSVHWGNCLGSPGFYESVVMDGVEYQIGDIVAVNPGEDIDEERAASSVFSAKYCTNAYARRVWFIQVQYFFDDIAETDSRGRPLKKLHGIWFSHGSETILKETAHGQQLYLLEECDSIGISTIFRKCNVHQLGAGEVEPPDVDHNKATDYFYRFMWDGSNCEFRNTPTSQEKRRARSCLPVHTPCVNCGLTAEDETHSQLRPLGPELTPNGFTQFGYNYHSGDFIYVKPKDSSASPFLIAQIINIEGLHSGDLNKLSCDVRYWKRYPDDRMHFKDERRLYRTRYTNTVQAKDIDGVCLVKLIDQGDVKGVKNWIREEREFDRFYANECETPRGFRVMEEEEFKVCHFCIEKYEQDMLEVEQYHLHNDRCATLDVFSGSGGLSEGMSQTGFFETKWAIEQSLSAAQTFQANHPNAHVLCNDVNAVLRYITEKQNGKAPTPLRSPDGSILPDESIPRRGAVDVLCGGPPCQPFSGANFFRREDDIRASLPFTMLSLCEVLEPKFVLLENVPGILQHSVSGNGERMEMGVVKLIIRVLTALGYQVRVVPLQAGQYGAAQDRERIFFVAAKCNYQLPDSPIPTHAFYKAAHRWKMPIRRSDHIRPKGRSRAPDEDHLYAPHPPISVDDAIGDLPAFDWSGWINPHLVIKETPEEAAEQHQRMLAGVVQCRVSKLSPVGFLDPVEYATEPRTRYQRSMRGNQALVDHHVTQAVSKVVVESTTLVPLKAWSNHRFLPEVILPQRMKRPKDSTNFYNRLDAAGHFKTAVTRPRPNGDKSYFIHPSQKRALSLREFARSQGFPDTYRFRSSEPTLACRLQDYFKLIGNAVPLPLAAALGRSIGSALVNDWRERRRRERSV